MRVFLFQRIVPAYRVGVFRRLYKILGVTVCHTPRTTINGLESSYREIDFEEREIPGRYIMGTNSIYTQSIVKLLIVERPDVIITEFALGFLTFWKLVLLKKIFKFKLIGWCHGVKNVDMIRSHKTFHYKITPFLFRLPDAVLFYSYERMLKIVRRVRNIQNSAFVAPNTLETDEINKSFEKVSRIGLKRIKEQLKLERTKYLIFVGRFLKDKRIDLIMDVFEMLRREHDLGIILIGDGPELERILKATSLDDVVLVGPLHDFDDTAKYLYAADIMLMPGYVGLGIVHGFAFGLPLITCKSTETGPFHSPEIEYLQHDYNGMICDSSVESIALCIVNLFKDKKKLAELKKNAFTTIDEKASISFMVDGFRQAIEYVRPDLALQRADAQSENPK